MVGLGIALGYVGPLATPVKWFPNRKGMVTGLVVAAFASGAFVLTGVEKLLVARGWTIFDVFIAFGALGFVGIAALSFLLTLPEDAMSPEVRRNIRLPEGILRTGHFWSLVVGFFSGTFAGLAVIGGFEIIGKSMGVTGAWLGASLMVFSIGNAVGRAGWGLLIEAIGTRLAVTASLALQAGSIALLTLGGHVGPVFALAAFCIGFNYGGCFVLYATEAAHTYGAHRVGTVYGLIYLVYIVWGLPRQTSRASLPTPSGPTLRRSGRRRRCLSWEPWRSSRFIAGRGSKRPCKASGRR